MARSLQPVAYSLQRFEYMESLQKILLSPNE